MLFSLTRFSLDLTEADPGLHRSPQSTAFQSTEIDPGCFVFFSPTLFSLDLTEVDPFLHRSLQSNAVEGSY